MLDAWILDKAYLRLSANGSLTLDATKLPGVHNRALSGYRLEVHFITRNFSDHKGIICVESFRRYFAGSNATFAELRAVAENEVLNSILGFDAFVEMLMTGEYNVDAMLHQKRLENLAQFETWTVLLSG